MKRINHYFALLAVAFVAVASSFSLVSCSDDMSADDLYTYKAEMLSDWLRNNEDFSKFAAIVERAGQMDLLSTYGTYTCFAPTNKAVDEYLQSMGLTSVDQLSVADCDTLTRTALIDKMYFTTELGEELDQASGEDETTTTTTAFIASTNLLGRYLTIESVPITIQQEQLDGTIKEVEATTYRINKSGTIIYELHNDSVENGVVHPVDGLVASSSETLPVLLKKDPNISIFYNCLEMTGLNQEMYRIKDASYDPYVWRLGGTKNLEKLYWTGAQYDYCHVPEERRYGYTAFCVPDSVLAAVYGITSWEDLYDYACTVYPEGAGSDYYGKDSEALKDERNPLHKLIAYHLLNRKGVYNKLYTNCTVYHALVNSVEWYSTMNPLSTLKVEHIAATANKFRGDATPNTLYLNRMYDPARPALTQRGAIVSTSVGEGLTQEAVNGVYYYIDRLIDYGATTQNTVFNNRMRIDYYTLFPECMNNDMRTTRTWGNLGTEDPNADARNYIFPPGYLDNVTVAEDGDFFLQNCRNYFWSYEGDEFNLRSDNNSYDITFNLPSVPSGQYQIRQGFCAMATRGIAQFYIDDIPQGIPLDMRNNDDAVFAQRIGGWIAIPDGTMSTAQKERLDQVKKDMHNLGWYHGPRSTRYVTTGAGSVKNDLLLSTSNSGSAASAARNPRKVIYEGYLDGNKQHTMRIRSVMAIGGAELMLDYIEIVPKSVYGVENEEAAEDDL
ncbi:MAG: fasciclin domain-containing protein [Bacteroidaceae bacterium]|nr:fasciclin domain-containing protein [Bacteroidaceae bacterium]